jgi:hypothetical protein
MINDVGGGAAARSARGFELNKVVDSYQGVPEGSQVALYA